jgi:hypothetical protein
VNCERPRHRRGRFAFLALTFALVAASVAYAADNTVHYAARASHKGKASTKKPASLWFSGTLQIDTTPPGRQPDPVGSMTFYFARQVVSNGKRLPSCAPRDVDGQSAIPPRCRPAIVGGGSMTGYLNHPDGPRSDSVTEKLTLNIVNGPGGLPFLTVSSADGDFLTLHNAVIPGLLLNARPPFGFGFRFVVPAELQSHFGLSMSLSDIVLTIFGAPRKWKVRGKPRSAPYLELLGCPGGRLPFKAVVVFRRADGSTAAGSSPASASC